VDDDFAWRNITKNKVKSSMSKTHTSLPVDITLVCHIIQRFDPDNNIKTGE
jgi:hypothetical protein